MTNSILNSVKKVLGIDADFKAFDTDVIMHINSVFFTLNQIGIGPVDGFAIEDDSAEWVDFLGTDKRLNAVKTYMYLRVRLLFDPPPTSFGIEAMQKQVVEHEWRLSVHQENKSRPNG